MAQNNSSNLTQLATKSVPTTSDLVSISDAAAGGIPKQATIGSIPFSPGQITTENLALISIVSTGIPGMFANAQSTTQTQSMASQLNTNVLFVPFYVSRSYTVTGGKFLTTVGVAASTVTMGIYAATVGGTFNNFPTGAALTAGSVATTASATYSAVTLSTTLTPNVLYWAAMQASTATTLSLGVVQLNISNPNIITQIAATGTWTANVLSYANSYSAGTLPTITQSSLVISARNYLPFMVIT